MGEVLFDLREVLDVLVPAEQVVVLQFLLVGQFDEVVVELGEHVEVCEGDVIADKEGLVLQMLLKVLD